MNNALSRALPASLFLLLAGAGAAAGPAPAEEGLRPIVLARREEGAYRSRLKGTETTRWEARWVLETSDTSSPFRYRVRDESAGTFGEDDLKLTKTTEAEFYIDRGEIRLVKSVLTIRDETGGVSKTLSAAFDRENRAARVFIAYPARGKEETEEFSSSRKLVGAKEIASFLRGFPFGEGNEIDFEILTEEPATYSITAVYDGTETVTVPAGTFSCHKLRLIPDLGILTFLGTIFAPDFYFWFSTEPPHLWVKFEGPDGEVGAPEIVSELISFTAVSAP